MKNVPSKISLNGPISDSTLWWYFVSAIIIPATKAPREYVKPIYEAKRAALTTIKRTEPIKSSSTSLEAEKCRSHVITLLPTINIRPITSTALITVSLKIISTLWSALLVKNPKRIKIGITAISWKISIPVACCPYGLWISFELFR